MIHTNEKFRVLARDVNRFVSSPMATAAAFVIVIGWLVTGPVFRFSDGWQLIINTSTSIVTFLMVFVLNSAQSRDTAAINAKLDAVIVAIETADNRMVGFEKQAEARADAVHQEIIGVIEAGEDEHSG